MLKWFKRKSENENKKSLTEVLEDGINREIAKVVVAFENEMLIGAKEGNNTFWFDTSVWDNACRTDVLKNEMNNTALEMLEMRNPELRITSTEGWGYDRYNIRVVIKS